MAYRLTPLSILVATKPGQARVQLERTLEKNGGDVKATAKALDVSRQCVYNWADRLGVTVRRRGDK